MKKIKELFKNPVFAVIIIVAFVTVPLTFCSCNKKEVKENKQTSVDVQLVNGSIVIIKLADSSQIDLPSYRYNYENRYEVSETVYVKLNDKHVPETVHHTRDVLMLNGQTYFAPSHDLNLEPFKEEMVKGKVLAVK